MTERYTIYQITCTSFLCKMKMINSVEYEALRNQSDSQYKVWQSIHNWLINYSSKVKCTHKSEFR